MGLFPKAFRKMKAPATVVEVPVVEVPTVVVETPKVEPNPSTLFNLVRIVEEHGPKRLEQIDGEVSKLNAKIQTLLNEREKVQALVLALKK